MVLPMVADVLMAPAVCVVVRFFTVLMYRLLVLSQGAIQADPSPADFNVHLKREGSDDEMSGC